MTPGLRQILSCLVFVALSRRPRVGAQTQPSPDKSRHIVLISLDGSRVGRSTIPICRFRRSGGWQRAARWRRACAR